MNLGAIAGAEAERDRAAARAKEWDKSKTVTVPEQALTDVAEALKAAGLSSSDEELKSNLIYAIMLVGHLRYPNFP